MTLLWNYFYALFVTTTLAAAIPQASIRPLFGLDVDGEYIVVCTASSINQDIGLWLTANHCKGEQRWIGQPQSDGSWAYHAVTAVFVNETHDVAVLFTDTLRVKSLHLATAEPVVDDEVIMLGFPLGWTTYQRSHGLVSSLSTHILADGYDYGYKTMFQLPVCRGNSGSPLLNMSGELISMAQLGPGIPCAPFTGGIPYSNLAGLVGKFFSRE